MLIFVRNSQKQSLFFQRYFFFQWDSGVDNKLQRTAAKLFICYKHLVARCMYTYQCIIIFVQIFTLNGKAKLRTGNKMKYKYKHKAHAHTQTLCACFRLFDYMSFLSMLFSRFQTVYTVFTSNTEVCVFNLQMCE